ncbi:MAG: YidC/Oxa1 family membrane protein insertase [Chloroflexota bacterium]|nr:YidC/Oxa1 family membrane protein insertase [Chloroflexota bacterium]
MWNSFVELLINALKLLSSMIGSLGIPYAFGFAIIFFTVIVRVLTFPLNWQQIKSSVKMQELQPQLEALQKKYRENKEKLAQEQMKLYREAGVNPLGGCLPMLIQFPIWIGLYRALYRLANQQLLGAFLWIKDLGFPPQGAGFSWIWKPYSYDISWLEVGGYLILPIVTIATQIIVQRMSTIPSSDPQQSAMNQTMMIMPVMFGFFAIQVPAGLVLYWVTSNLLQLAQQYLAMNYSAATLAQGE